MPSIDPFGRLAPSSLDLSRAAAVRHAHLAALRDRDVSRTPQQLRRRWPWPHRLGWRGLRLS